MMQVTPMQANLCYGILSICNFFSLLSAKKVAKVKVTLYEHLASGFTVPYHSSISLTYDFTFGHWTIQERVFMHARH